MTIKPYTKQKRKRRDHYIGSHIVDALVLLRSEVMVVKRSRGGSRAAFGFKRASAVGAEFAAS